MTATATSVMVVRPLPGEFEQIFRENAEFVYRTASRITGCVEDAEDVLQTIFVNLLRRPLPPDFHVNPKAYLYRSAVNASLNVIRAKKRNLLTESPEDYEDATSRRNEFRRELEIQERLRTALSELNEKAAEILILRYVHGYSDVEIAALLGTSRGTIAVSLFRSRARLRQVLRALEGGAL